MKKTPFLVLILISIAVAEMLGIIGSFSIYATEEIDVLKTPFLSKVMTGINDEEYPWMLLDAATCDEKRAEADELKLMEKEMLRKQEEASLLAETPQEASAMEAGNIAPAPLNVSSEGNAPGNNVSGNNVSGNNVSGNSVSANGIESTPEPTPMYPEGRYEPLFESTYDEYKAHISADVFGDMGVLRAAEYDFVKVNIDYFNDALFIGDSRTVGLRNYTELPQHADFRCATSLNIWDVLKSDFKGAGTLDSALKSKKYGKIYIMMGVNEVGTGTTEMFYEEYAKVVDHIRELQPDAKIIIQAIMHVDKERSDSDSIVNNTNIEARNHALAVLADNENIFYIDENEVLTDEDGYLRDDLKGDHLHLKAESNAIWLDFLLDHGIKFAPANDDEDDE